jgi:hypothetical protein
MHPIIESLPIILGFFIAHLDRRTKPILFKHATSILLCAISGTIVNWLSKEGIELLIVDVLTTSASTFAFILLDKKLFWRMNSIIARYRKRKV